MTYRDTIIHVLNQIASDKRMQNRADYWARICGEAATLLKQDERAMESQPLGHINTPSVRNNTNVLMKCPFCGGAAQLSHKSYGVGIQASYILCPGCGCTTKGFDVSATYASDEKAAEAWNRRVNDA